jgi:twinkle protein
MAIRGNIVSAMSVGDVMKRLTITKSDVDEWTGEHVTDFKIKTTLEYADDLLKYYNGEFNQGLSLGWSKTDDYFRVRMGELTIVQGVSGSGKTMWLSQVTMYLLGTKKVMIASLEMRPVLTLHRFVTQTAKTCEPTESYIHEILDRANEKLFIYDQEGTTTSYDMEAVVSYGKHVLGIDVFVIDSLMKMSDINEDNYDKQKNFVDRLAVMARDLGVHIFLVCHTKKLSEDFDVPEANHILGSSHIRNLSDNVVAIWRNKHKERRMANNELTDEEMRIIPDAKLCIQKQRNYIGENSEAIINFWYDKKSLRYKERP